MAGEKKRGEDEEMVRMESWGRLRSEANVWQKREGDERKRREKKEKKKKRRRRVSKSYETRDMDPPLALRWACEMTPTPVQNSCHWPQARRNFERTDQVHVVS